MTDTPLHAITQCDQRYEGAYHQIRADFADHIANCPRLHLGDIEHPGICFCYIDGEENRALSFGAFKDPRTDNTFDIGIIYTPDLSDNDPPAAPNPSIARRI
jgi:hypothetical protein